MNLTVADAQEEKGILIKLWEKVSSKWAKPQEQLEKGKTAGSVTEKDGATPVRPAIKETLETKFLFSKEALIKEIGLQIKKYPELLERIPALSERKSMDGNVDYYYKYSSDIPLKLDKHERPVLLNLLNDIKKEAATMKTPAPSAEKVSQPAKPVKPDAVKTKPAVPEPPKEMPFLMDDEDMLKRPSKGERPEGEYTGEAAVEGSYSGEPGRPEIPFTREEMLEVIKGRLRTFSELPFMIPGILMEKQPDGTVAYSYQTEEGTFALEDLDKETLHKLFVRINNEAAVLSSQRVIRQIQQQEQLTRAMQQQVQQQAQQVLQVQRQSAQPVTPPVVFTPPQPPPQPPQLPQQPPRPPQQPPQPPPQPPRR